MVAWALWARAVALLSGAGVLVTTAYDVSGRGVAVITKGGKGVGGPAVAKRVASATASATAVDQLAGVGVLVTTTAKPVGVGVAVHTFGGCGVALP